MPEIEETTDYMSDLLPASSSKATEDGIREHARNIVASALSPGQTVEHQIAVTRDGARYVFPGNSLPAFWNISGPSETRAPLTSEQIQEKYPHQSLETPRSTPWVRTAPGPAEEYLQLLNKLGIVSTVVQEARLEAVIEKEHIHVYDYERVEIYLNNQRNRKCAEYLTENPTHQLGVDIEFIWAWYPLRKQDRKKAQSSSSVPAKVAFEIYRHAVPPVPLQTIATISEHMPDALFFVTELTKEPDPFLGVTVPGSQKIWVVERWDEPSFR